MNSIPYMIFRGGTSKGPFFFKNDLPKNETERKNFLSMVMGSPHPYQVDGIGGGVPNASKIGIVSRSKMDGVDIEYSFGQVDICDFEVDMSGDCGNMLSAVGYFAIESHLVEPVDGHTTVRIYSPNTKSIKEISVPVANGHAVYKGDYHIDGVEGTGAELSVSFINPGASQTGSVFPTGNRIDVIDGINVTLIDCARALVIVNAKDVEETGYESTEELKENSKLNQKLETLRIKAAKLMGINNPSKTFPKIAMINQPRSGGDLSVRYWSAPADCQPHPALAMTAAMALAAGVCMRGTILNLSNKTIYSNIEKRSITLEQPKGQVEIGIEASDNPVKIKACSYKRTARLIAKGEVFYA